MEPIYTTDLGKLYNGDALSVLKEIESESVSMCITSPPYWALRDYGVEGQIWDGDPDCEHEWGSEIPYIKYDKRTPEEKRKSGCTVGNNLNSQNFAKGTSGKICIHCGAWKGQLGLEPDFNLYIKHLCDIFDEVKRVLRKDGTCWVNLGDTYAGGGGNSSKYKCGPNGIDKREHARPKESLTNRFSKWQSDTPDSIQRCHEFEKDFGNS